MIGKLIIKTINGHVFPIITSTSNSNENLTTCSSVCIQGPRLASFFSFFKKQKEKTSATVLWVEPSLYS